MALSIPLAAYILSSSHDDRPQPGLGLTSSDVNRNVSHNIFNGNFGLDVVDSDRFGNILSLAGRRQVVDPVPEPATVALLGIGIVGLAGAEVRRRRKKKAVDKS